MLTKLALLLSLILSEAVVSGSEDIKVDNNGDMCSVKKSSPEVLFFAKKTVTIQILLASQVALTRVFGGYQVEIVENSKKTAFCPARG